MAKISPRKEFNFKVYFPLYAIEPFLVQKVTLPDVEIDAVPHSEGNYDVKTAGRTKVGTITLENILRSTAGTEASFFWDWNNMAQDMYLGGGVEPAGYYRTMIVEELGTDGASVINRWICEETWPHKIGGQKHDRKSSDNTVETVELSVNRIDKTF